MAPLRRSRRLKQRRNQPNQPNQRVPVGWDDLPIEIKEPIYKFVLDLTDHIIPLACPVRRAREINNNQGRWVVHESFYRGLSVYAVNGTMRDEARRTVQKWRTWQFYTDVLDFGFDQARLTHDGPTPDNYIELLNQVIPNHVRERIGHLVIHMDHLNCLYERLPAYGGPVSDTDADIRGAFDFLKYSNSCVTIWCPTFEEGWKYLEILPCFWDPDALNRVRNMKISRTRAWSHSWKREINWGPYHQGQAAFQRFPTPATWARDWAAALSRSFRITMAVQFPISMKKMALVKIQSFDWVDVDIVARKNSVCGWSYEPRRRPDALPDRLKMPGSSLRRAARLAR